MNKITEILVIEAINGIFNGYVECSMFNDLILEGLLMAKYLQCPNCGALNAEPKVKAKRTMLTRNVMEVKAVYQCGRCKHVWNTVSALNRRPITTN